MPHSTHGSASTMSRPSSTSTSSANAFPRPAGATLRSPTTVQDQLSPSRSTFSFESAPRSVQSPSDKAVAWDEARNTRDLDYGAPGEKRNSGGRYGTRQQTRYFEEQFATRDDTTTARDRITKDAPIIADLKTNVIIKDEYTLVTDLSQYLSQRYQRPETSIMITFNHSACLLLGGSFDPTYVLTISALPVQLQPTTNKRNASLIQSFLYESLGVQAERGVVKFVPIQEECLALNGMTILGDIERLERQYGEETSGVKRALTKSSKRSAIAKAKSSFQLSRKSVDAPDDTAGPPRSPMDSGVAVSDEGKDSLAPLQTDASYSQKRGIKHSASKQFRERGGVKTSTIGLVSPTTPGEDNVPRIGKRKSFMTLFRK